MVTSRHSDELSEWRAVRVASYQGGELSGWRVVRVASCKVTNCTGIVLSLLDYIL
jgi:hypothetical protein